MLGNLFYNVPNTEPLELAKGADPLVRRKELIYCDPNFQKKTANIDLKFGVDIGTLQHWHNTFVAMFSNGVEVPVTKEHTQDPDKRRGTLIKTEIAQNKKGIPSLYGYFRFKDEESLKLAADSQVSIYSPEEYIDGKGNKYIRPIQHVAITDYPVIPGLEKFEAIALSLITLSENDKMSLKSVAKKLGIDDKTEEKDLEAAISKAIDALLKKVDVKASDPPVTDPPAPVTDPAKPPAPVADPAKPAAAPVVSASMVSLMRDNRTMKIDALVGKSITPAVATDLKAAYCNDKALTLSLSNMDPANPDNFDSVLKAIAKNDPVILREKTGAQANLMALSTLDDNNPLVKNAERRAAEAKA